MGSRRREAIASAAARAPEMVVMQGMRHWTAVRRMAHLARLAHALEVERVAASA